MTGLIKVSIKSIVIFLLSVLCFSIDSFQDVYSSTFQQQQQSEDDISNSSSSTVQPTNDSGTIQCITTPCEYPSPQPMPPESNNNTDTTSIPRNVTQVPDFPQTGPNNAEPCISPCPPGEICIQMCKPIGEVGTSNSESDSLAEETQGPQQNESTFNSDVSSENQDGTNEIEEETNANNNNNDESQDTSESTES
jgi:hypothetical protein